MTAGRYRLPLAKAIPGPAGLCHLRATSGLLCRREQGASRSPVQVLRSHAPAIHERGGRGPSPRCGALVTLDVRGDNGPLDQQHQPVRKRRRVDPVQTGGDLAQQGPQGHLVLSGHGSRRWTVV